MIVKSLNNNSTKLLLAILGTLIAFCASPDVINNIGNLNFLLTVTPIVILCFYFLTRKYENYYLLALTSLILFVSYFVNIYVGLFFTLSFPVVYLTDEFKNKNYKDGLSAFAIIFGVYLIFALWVQDWIPGYDNTTLFALAFNMSGVILILFWCAWIQHGLPSARKTLAFSLPAVLLFLLWITYNGTGKEIFSTIHKNMTNGEASFRDSYVFTAIVFHKLWYIPIFLLKVCLVLLGIWQLYKKQLGIVVLFILLIVSCFWCFSWCKELATILNVLIAIISSFGIIKIINLINQNITEN